MIKKSFRLMLLVAFALSSVMFVACNKYDDDIERIDNEIASLQATVQSLKAAVDGGAVISSVSNTAEGVKFTLSNGQSYVVNHGTAGADGAAGKDGSVVTIGENGNWFIDGVDTDMPAKGQGEPGKAPRINEAGNWEIWNAETETWDDTNVSAAGASTYVVESGAYYILNVMEKDAEGNNLGYKTINLNRTAEVTSLEVVRGNGSIYKDDYAGTTIIINYGYKVATAFKFNDVPYAKNSTLIARGTQLSAMINPLDAEASLYDFVLMDSKGAMPYVLGTPTQNMSEAPLTRADPTPNKGVWDMTVNFADGISFDATKVSARETAAYALATATPEKQIASRYDVSVNENKVTKVNSGSSRGGQKLFRDMKRPVTKSMNLLNCFTYDGTGVITNDDGTPKTHPRFTVSDEVNGADHEVDDLNPYIVDCYFEIADKTIAEQYGLKLDGYTLTAEKPVDNVKINVYYLFVDGSKGDGSDDYPAGTINASFTYVAPTGALGNVEWTIQNDNPNTGKDERVVYLPLGDLQASLVASADNQLPSFVNLGWTWTDGKGLDTKKVVIDNGTKDGMAYGKDQTAIDRKFTGNEKQWLADINPTLVTFDDDGDEATPTKIQDELYVKFTFTPSQAFRGEYIVKLGFRKYGSSANVVEVPVNVTIIAPEVPIVRLENYFAGNDAVAYGEANGTVATFDLNKLFVTTGLTYAETAVAKNSSTNYPAWLSGTSVSVPAYVYGSSHPKNMVYATREYTAKLVPFNNPHMDITKDVFNLTVKSPIYEGSFTSQATQTIDSNTAKHFSVNDFTGVDVYGNKFYVGNVYKYDSENGVYTNTVVEGTGMDTKYIKSVSVSGDTNAKQYLTFDTAFTKHSDFGAADAFEVARKTDLPQLQNDVTCTLTVTVLDNWGMKSQATVTVVVKAFGN